MGERDGLWRFGHSKDDPTLRQIKAMMATLDPLGLPMGLEVVSGEQADDRLYVPMIDRVLACLERTGLLFVGDSKMSALATRAHLVAREQCYLTRWLSWARRRSRCRSGSRQAWREGRD